MPETRTISPAEGRRVLDPDRGLPLEPRSPVAWSSYWQRRLDAGDVVETEKKGR